VATGSPPTSKAPIDKDRGAIWRRENDSMKKLISLLGLLIVSFTAMGADISNGADSFYKSDKVTMQKVSFKNQYQMNVVGNLFVPKGMSRSGRNPAIIVGHPMGGKGAKLESLRSEAGRAGVRHPVPGPVVLGRKRGPGPQCRFAGHLCRGFQCCGGLPGNPALRGQGTDRRSRDLRKRKLRH
jgi:hypothetical protein